MPLGQFGTPPSADISTKDLADLVARLIKEVTYLLNGGLDTLNVNELSADVINAGTLNAALVTVKAALTGAAYILINAAQGLIINDGTKNTFQADINGLVTMVGALIQSATGYPRVEINGTNNVLAAYKASNSYVAINPNLSANVPGIEFWLSTVNALMYLFNPGTPELFIATPVGQANIDISSGIDLLLNAQGNLKINGSSGYTGTFSVVSSVNFGAQTTTTKTITVTKGIITNVV
jgi:hypothetical protein